MNYLLSFIIVNYNTGALLAECVKSVKGQLTEGMELIVVDNNSSDDSFPMMCTLYPWVRVIANTMNLGFSRANNQGVAASRGRYLFFLNPDTVVQDNCLHNVVRYMEGHPRAGLAGTALLNSDLTPHPTVEYTYPGHRHARKELQNLPAEIAWVLGASMVARRDVFAQVGGFDERYFLYSEDIDLCLAIRKLGWEIGYIKDALVVHHEGASERGRTPLQVFAKKLLAEQLFFAKHYLPETVARINRQRKLEAWWRLFSLHIAALFSRRGKPRILRKIEKYRKVLDVCTSSAVNGEHSSDAHRSHS